MYSTGPIEDLGWSPSDSPTFWGYLHEKENRMTHLGQIVIGLLYKRIGKLYNTNLIEGEWNSYNSGYRKALKDIEDYLKELENPE